MNFTQPRSFIGMLCILVSTMISLPNSGTAQSPTDAVMMEGKRICVAGMFNQDKWDEYWEGTLLRNNGNIGELTRNTYSLMAVSYTHLDVYKRQGLESIRIRYQLLTENSISVSQDDSFFTVIIPAIN